MSASVLQDAWEASTEGPLERSIRSAGVSDPGGLEAVLIMMKNREEHSLKKLAKQQVIKPETKLRPNSGEQKWKSTL